MLILLILAFHSFSAYIVSQPAGPFPFDEAPYRWLAFPIVDEQRWLGFDLICAFLFLYLMQLMFFLSGLFVWPSLVRKGWRNFFGHRLVRLGVPFLLGTYLLMPIAYDAVYRVTAVDPSWSAFWAHWSALPITPTGPMWFLWFLIALNAAAVVLQRPLSAAGPMLLPLARKAEDHPAGVFICVVGVTALAYLPLSAFYSPWQWVGLGPLEIQPSLAPQYALYFLLGLAAGAYGYDRGLLGVNGPLSRHWSRWAVGCGVAFALWIIPTALIEKQPGAPEALLQCLADFGLVTFAAAACFAMTAMFLRFATARWPVVDTISENSYGIYFFHYAFVLWLQFALLGTAWPAVGKGLLVLALTVLLSWTASVMTTRVMASAGAPLARLLKSWRRRVLQPAASSGAGFRV